MSTLRKRSVLLAGHATSIALEPEFWTVLEAMAAARGTSLAGLILSLDRARGERPLASACRVTALEWAGVGRQPLATTQNGEAKAVLQDVASYEQQQETLALLKILALGAAEIEAGQFRPFRDAIADLKQRLKPEE